MKVKILRSLPRTIDGKKIGPFTQGQECELDDATARTFIASAFAEEVLPPVEMMEQNIARLQSDMEGAASFANVSTEN